MQINTGAPSCFFGEALRKDSHPVNVIVDCAQY